MTNIREIIDNIYPEIVNIRRDFHANPELSQHEIRTSEKICQYLKDWHIPFQNNVAGYGVIAYITGKKTPPDNQKFKAVGIRADMDALAINEENQIPYKSVNHGVMHACGHDLHTAVLLGTAKILKDMESEFAGTVKFFFQPSEETIGGANQMIQAGCLENPRVSAVIALHVEPSLDSGKVGFRRGKMNAASTEFYLTVKGHSCHGAHPDLGIDPVLTAAHIVTSLQSIVSRNLSPVDSGLITVGQFHAGSQNNIIPSEAAISGIIRSFDNQGREFLKQRLSAIAKNTAAAFGGEAVVTFRDSYPALINDEEIGLILEKTAYAHMTEENIVFIPDASLGADDFAYFTQAVQGVYFNIGTNASDGKHPQTLHNEYFNPDEKSMKTGMLMEVMGALEILRLQIESQ